MNLFKFITVIILTIQISYSSVELSFGNYIEADGTADVLYNSTVDIGGFQFEIEGATLTGASGGEASNNGFVTSNSSTTLLGFSFSGAIIPAGNGVLTTISFSNIDEETCLENPVMSDPSGNSLTIILIDSCVGGDEIEGCMNNEACNFDETATIDNGCIYAEENYDCDGNCIIEIDCNGICGGTAEVDNCDICDNFSSNDCNQDCLGVWGGNAEADECGICNGDGPSIECENGNSVCFQNQCDDCGPGYFPNYGPDCQWSTSVSTTQAYIIFDSILLNSEPIVNGTENGTTTGGCTNDDCDILGAIYNGQVVGWSYLPIINNQITIAIQMKDSNTEAVAGYPLFVPGTLDPTVTFNFYDASEGQMYYNVGAVQPISSGLVNIEELNITESGDVCSSDGFVFGATDFCLEGIGCEYIEYCNGSSTNNFDAIGNNPDSCEKISTCGILDAVNYDSNSECPLFINDASFCLFDGCNDIDALNFNPDELVGYSEFNVGCIYDPFEWESTTLQSFYVIDQLIIDGNFITDDYAHYVIGAYCNDVAVGSAQWNGENTTIAVYGYDGLTEGTEDYCFGGMISPIEMPADIPEFKVYDGLNDIYYSAYFDSCLDIEGNDSNCAWLSFGFSNIPSLTTTIPGCTNEDACNYSEIATVDDGSCFTPEDFGWCDCEENIEDCNGECGGSAIIDYNGFCCDNNSLFDDCIVCNGGNLDQDCSGTCFGTAILDNQEICCNSEDIDNCGGCFGNNYDFCDFDENGISNLEQYGYGVYNIEVSDIYGDQGFHAYISFTGSFLDNQSNAQNQQNEMDREVEIYQIERLDEIGWVSVGQSVMYGQASYNVQVPTIINQTNEAEGLSTFRVLSAFEDEIIISFENGVGATIDNINPQIPESLNGIYQNNLVELLWANPSDEDFQYFKIYKNEQLLSYSTSPLFIDDFPSTGLNHFYQVTAVDFHGNESDLSTELYTIDICNEEQSECYGCTDISAENFLSTAILDDGNCEFSPVIIQDDGLENYNSDIDFDLPEIELSEINVSLDIPAGAFDVSDGSQVNLEIMEASESELENILFYSSSADAEIEIFQGCTFEATDENGIAIELVDGATIDIEISFELTRNEYDLGYVQENGEIIGLDAICTDNGNDTMTCNGNGEGFGSYIVYTFDSNSVVFDCTMSDACNYNELANMNNGSCFYYGIYDCDGICVNDSDGDLICNELEVLGCTDEEASNYDIEATDDSGTCSFGYSFSHQLGFGNNLISLPGELENNSTLHQMDLITSNGEEVDFIIGQGVGLFNTIDGWTGNLNSLSPYSGYWINISGSENYNWGLEFNRSIEACEIYSNITFGNNLLSYKWGTGSTSTIYALGGLEFASANFNFIIGQGVGLFKTIDGWSGNLNSLEEGKGYWVNVSNDELDNFNWGFDNCENIPNNLGLATSNNYSNLPEEYVVNQSTEQAFYLIKDIENSEIGDIILAHYQNTLVGSAIIENGLTILPIMGRDFSEQTEGFLELNDIPSLKLVKSTGKIIELNSDVVGFKNLSVSEIELIKNSNEFNPNEFLLHPAYPNPFNPITTISFSVPVGTWHAMSIDIFDINGHLIETLIDGQIETGHHSIDWNANSYPSGVYFIKLEAGDPSVNSGQGFTQTQKLMLVK
jgi:hypothetical protein